MSEHKNKKNYRHHRKKQPWPLFLLFGGVLLLIIGASFAFRKPPLPKAAIEVNGSPSLKVDKQRVNLGDVKLGQTVDVKFTLMNVGDKTLRFSKAPYIEVTEGC